jgi:hypothetical protein
VSDTFDINNRRTWDWVYPDPGQFPDEIGDYRLDPENRESFYQMSDGVPYIMPCPAGQVFNPIVRPGPVCDSPLNCSEADIYGWAVSKGLVNDQR